MKSVPAVTAVDDPVAPADAPTEGTQVVDAGETARGRPPRPGWAAAAILAIAPVVILLVLRVSPYFRQNNGDPFIYAGYANDFHGHVVRFSYTYYAVRWGLIFPMRAALAFGPVWGYFVLRYVLYQLAIVPLYFALRPWGDRVALFGVVAFVANPVTAQAILSTYHDSIAVPVLTAVVSILVIASRSSSRARVAWCAAAGTLVGVGLNANLFVIPVAGVAMLAFCALLLRGRRIRETLLAGSAFVVGMVAVSLSGVLAYDAMFDDPNIYETSLRALDEIAGDTTWRSPSPSWLLDRWYVYAPFVAVALGVVALFRRRVAWTERPAFLLAIAIGAGSLAWFVVHQFLLGGYTMEHAYYFSYVIGPVCLMVGAAAGELTVRSRPLSLLVVASPIPLAWVAQPLEVPEFVMFAVLAVAAIVTMTRLHSASAVVVVALAVMHVAWGSAPRDPTEASPGSFHYEPHYEQTFGDVDTSAFDAYVLANRLTSVVPTIGVARPPVLFWYPTGDPMLDSVQSSYLWELTAVQRAPNPGMPTLTDDDRARLLALATPAPPDHLPGFVVLMARTVEHLDAGLAALRGTGLSLDVGRVTALNYGDSTIHTLVVRVSLPA
jgi:hypothetical protein